MPAIRPAPDDTSFNTPAMAETSGTDYLKNIAYDSLYHSPVSAISRLTEDKISEHDTDSKMLSTADANKEYGLDGTLNFDEPVRESYASLLQDRKLAEMRRDYEISSGSQNSWGRRVTGLGTSMVSSLADPVNLASMFFGVGELNALSGVQKATGFLNRGLISPRAIIGFTGTNPLKFNLTKGAINGLLGTAVSQPFDVAAGLEEKEEGTWENSLKTIAAGGVLGAAFHTAGAVLGDMFKKFKIGGSELDPQTNEASIRSAVSDLMQDKPVESPADILSVDHNVVQDELQSVNKENLITIAQEHLNRLNELSEQGSLNPTQALRRQILSKMMENPTSATPDNLAAMFSLKLNDTVDKMPDAYRFISQNKTQSAPFSDSKFERFYDEHISGAEIEDHQALENARDAKPEFKEVIKDLQRHGYDVLNAQEVKYGSNVIAFILPDKVVKISDQEIGHEIKGVSTESEHEFSNADFHAWVEPKVTPLDQLNQHPGDYQSLVHAVQILAKMNGLSAEDLHAGNLGLDSNNNFRVLDRGVFQGSGDSPNHLPPEFLVNQLGKSAKKEQVLSMLKQLVKQSQVERQSVQDRILSKVNDITQRRQGDEMTKSSEKSLDSKAEVSKNPYLEKVSENRTPEEPVNGDTIAHDVQNLKSEVSNLTKDLKQQNDSEKDLGLKDQDAAAKKYKDVVSKAVGCISQKAV